MKVLRKTNSNRKLRIEALEDKRLLTIVWANEFDATPALSPDFDEEYGADEIYARAIVNRAIDDWNSVIIDQDWDNDGDPDTNDVFNLTVLAENIAGRGLTNITSVTAPVAGQRRAER